MDIALHPLRKLFWCFECWQLNSFIYRIQTNHIRQVNNLGVSIILHRGILLELLLYVLQISSSILLRRLECSGINQIIHQHRTLKEVAVIRIDMLIPKRRHLFCMEMTMDIEIPHRNSDWFMREYEIVYYTDLTDYIKPNLFIEGIILSVMIPFTENLVSGNAGYNRF